MPFLKKLGEIEIIRRLQAYIDSTTLLGTNEDAYLYNDKLPYILINIDTMSRNSDFLPSQSWSQIGAKLVVMTFSDLAAKGATPELFLSSLILEDTMQEDDLKNLVQSMQKTAHNYGAKYQGGDLGASSETVLTGVGIGSIKEGKILTRDGAKEGDLVCVTGHFGKTAIGLDNLLPSPKKKFDSIPDTILKTSINKLFEPQPRITEGMLLSKYNLASASIDSSDGLAISLHWLSEASNVGIQINYLPIDHELESFIKSDEDILKIVMFGGEEYELVFTISPTILGKLEELFKQYKCHFHIIGECGKFKGVRYKNKSIEMRGWDSFRKKSY